MLVGLTTDEAISVSKISPFARRVGGVSAKNESHEYFREICFNYEPPSVFGCSCWGVQRRACRNNLRSLTSITDIISICSQHVEQTLKWVHEVRLHGYEEQAKDELNMPRRLNVNRAWLPLLYSGISCRKLIKNSLILARMHGTVVFSLPLPHPFSSPQIHSNLISIIFHSQLGKAKLRTESKAHLSTSLGVFLVAKFSEQSFRSKPLKDSSTETWEFIEKSSSHWFLPWTLCSKRFWLGGSGSGNADNIQTITSNSHYEFLQINAI